MRMLTFSLDSSRPPASVLQAARRGDVFPAIEGLYRPTPEPQTPAARPGPVHDSAMTGP
jgi:hypothetical protein